MFESSVNSEGIETERSKKYGYSMFESSVNSEGIETEEYKEQSDVSLRAV